MLISCIMNTCNSAFRSADFREIEALRSKHADIEALCSAQLLETKELIRRKTDLVSLRTPQYGVEY